MPSPYSFSYRIGTRGLAAGHIYGTTHVSLADHQPDSGFVPCPFCRENEHQSRCVRGRVPIPDTHSYADHRICENELCRTRFRVEYHPDDEH